MSPHTKEYIINTGSGYYIEGVGSVRAPREKATRYTRHTLPDNIGSRALYEDGNNPKNWRYTANCFMRSDWYVMEAS